MNKLLIIISLLLLVGCGESTPKVFKVEFNSGKIYRVKATGYYHSHDSFIHFYDEQGMFPTDSVKSITVENYE